MKNCFSFYVICFVYPVLPRSCYFELVHLFGVGILETFLRMLVDNQKMRFLDCFSYHKDQTHLQTVSNKCNIPTIDDLYEEM